MAKKESNKKKNDKKNNNKKFKDAYSIRVGPRLQTWLVWFSMFGLGVGFLAFGNVKFFTMQRVETVNSVPVWTQEVVETVTREFKSDSNNLKETGGYLNYFDNEEVYRNALLYYNLTDNSYTYNLNDDYYPYDDPLSYPLFDSNYFEEFAEDGYILDRGNSYFLYYIEAGSNVILNFYRDRYYSYSAEPGIVHSIPYSSIYQDITKGFSTFRLFRSYKDPNNMNLEDNIIKLYPAVNLRFKRGQDFYDVKSYTIFEVEERVTKKTEMVLNYEDRYSYHYEYKLNMSWDDFANIGNSLLNNIMGYFGKFLNMWNTVYDFLAKLYNFLIDGLFKTLNGVGGFISDAKDFMSDLWDKINGVESPENVAIIYIEPNLVNYRSIYNLRRC